jgi:hypothetical protein
MGGTCNRHVRKEKYIKNVGRKILGKPRHKREDNIKMGVKKILCMYIVSSI